MICERCGSKGRNIRTHVLRVTYESGNGFIYNLCSDCVRDIERFIKTEPRFNAFGYNLDFEKNCEDVYKEGGKLENDRRGIPGIPEAYKKAK